MSQIQETEKKFYVVTDQDGFVNKPKPLPDHADKRECAAIYATEICEMYPYEDERDRGEYTITLRSEAMYAIPEKSLKKPLDQCEDGDHLSDILDEDKEDECRVCHANYIMRPDSAMDNEAGDHVHEWEDYSYSNNTNGGLTWRYICKQPGCYRQKITESMATHPEKGIPYNSERIVTLDDDEKTKHDDEYPIPKNWGGFNPPY